MTNPRIEISNFSEPHQHTLKQQPYICVHTQMGDRRYTTSFSSFEQDMSLYANINVSKTQGDRVTIKNPPPQVHKSSKSAALYAGVLAKPPPPSNIVPQRHEPSPEVLPPPIDI